MGVLFVALGGAVGAMGRYAISLIPVKMEQGVCAMDNRCQKKIQEHPD